MVLSKQDIQVPSFETKRLILKQIAEADIPSYEKYFIDYDVIGNLSDIIPWPYPKNGVADFLQQFALLAKNNDCWLWGIFEKQKPDELIGCIELRRKGEPENRGFWLGKAFWGKGYMTEAVCPIMDHAFGTLGFEKLTFTNALGNIKSRRIKEKTGARFIGTSPAKFVNPNYTENEIWEITKDEWQKFKKRSAIQNQTP